MAFPPDRIANFRVFGANFRAQPVATENVRQVSAPEPVTMPSTRPGSRIVDRLHPNVRNLIQQKAWENADAVRSFETAKRRLGQKAPAEGFNT